MKIFTPTNQPIMMSPPMAANDIFPLRSEMMLLALLAMMRCLPHVPQDTSSAKRHHARSAHHLPARGPPRTEPARFAGSGERANFVEKTSPAARFFVWVGDGMDFCVPSVRKKLLKGKRSLTEAPVSTLFFRL